MADYLQLFRLIPAFEGELSKDPRDPAAKVPVNQTVEYHTNKGVQYATFLSIVPKLGYAATYDLFLRMPDDLLRRIFKFGYWDPMRGDDIASQAAANQIVDWAWGSGPGTAGKQVQRMLNSRFPGIVKQANNGQLLVVDGATGPRTVAALNAVPEAQLVPALAEAREGFLRSLGMPWYINGWLNRVWALVPSWLKKKEPQQRA